MKDLCYTYIFSTNTIGVIHRGEAGYYKTDIAKCNNITTAQEGEVLVAELNEKLGLTTKEVLAMQYGSMFGWDIPAANPNNWTDKEAKMLTNMASGEKEKKYE